MLVHVDAAALSGTENGGRCELDDGAPLTAQTARRLACDASIVRLLERDGKPLRIGRKTRAIPPAVRRALRSRDRGCRFPGCSARRFIDAHHIEHWANGGATDLENLVQLCGAHHRLLHEGGYGIRRLPGGGLTFVRPDGRPIPDCPTGPAGASRPPAAHPPPRRLRAALARPARPRTRRRRDAHLRADRVRRATRGMKSTSSNSASVARAGDAGDLQPSSSRRAIPTRAISPCTERQTHPTASQRTLQRGANEHVLGSIACAPCCSTTTTPSRSTSSSCWPRRTARTRWSCATTARPGATSRASTSTTS